MISPGHHPAWPYTAGAHLKTLFDQGRLSEGEKLGREYLLAAERQEIGYPANLIRMPFALIEAKLGKRHNAQDLADEAIANWNALGATGVYLGLAYETRARVAIYNDDPQSFRVYAKLCGQLWRSGNNPALIAKHEKLMQDARQAYLGMSQEIKQASELANMLSQSGDLVSAVQSHLADFQRSSLDLDLFDIDVAGTICNAKGQSINPLIEVDQPAEIQVAARPVQNINTIYGNLSNNVVIPHVSLDKDFVKECRLSFGYSSDGYYRRDVIPFYFFCTSRSFRLSVFLQIQGCGSGVSGQVSNFNREILLSGLKRQGLVNLKTLLTPAGRFASVYLQLSQALIVKDLPF